MGTKKEDLDAIIALLTEEEPVPLSAPARDPWSGRTTEVTEGEWEWHSGADCGQPRLDGKSPDITYWFIIADADPLFEAGVLFWEKDKKYFGRRPNPEQWDLFLEAIRVLRNGQYTRSTLRDRYSAPDSDTE